MKVVAAPMTLIVALMATACIQSPQPVTNVGGREGQNSVSALKPKEGLTFKYQSTADGANTNGSVPIHDWEEYAVSDGSVIVEHEYSFKQPGYADKFYSDVLARSANVLLKEQQTGDSKDAWTQRAVIEFVSSDGQTQGAVVRLWPLYVDEITGPSIGHVLAFEQWGSSYRRQHE